MTETSLQQEMLSTATSVGDMLQQRIAATPNTVAYLEPDPKQEGNWLKYTWAQSGDVVYELAAGLLARGLKPEERVGIISNTRVEWIFSDLAIACSAGATTTVYPNTQTDDVEYILSDSGSVIVIAENAEQLAKVLGADSLASQVHTVVVFDPTGVNLDDRVISYAQLRELGAKHLQEQPDSVQQAIDSTGHKSLATLIYTSGTTGRPKGVRLLHEAWVYEGAATRSWDLLSPDDLQYLWLPLSHVFGKALVAVQLSYGFASAVDGRLDKIVDGLGQVNPTFMCGAPRIFEKVRAAVLTKEGVSAKIAKWAFSVGARSRPYRLEGKPLPGLLRVQYKIASKLVFSKLQQRLGGRIRFMISGAAKLSPQVQSWFYSADILIVEGYGATETSAVAFVNLPTEPEFGTVGRVLPGIETKIADDGEVLLRGPIVTPGYHNLPDVTDEVLTEDGWYHTGDIGEFTAAGNLRITDRKKDLFKTSGGKYIAPQKVEGAIVANIPYITQAVAVGEGRKYASALVVMEPENLKKWAAKRGHESKSYAELTQLPELHATLERQMEKVNARLERWETVKRFAILPEELTVENEGVTPNMKIRRSSVNEKYADVIDSLYDKEDDD